MIIPQREIHTTKNTNLAKLVFSGYVQSCEWDSQIGRGVGSSYMEDVCTATRKHLFVKKSDAETNFYYMGLFDVIEVKADKKKDNNGKERDIAKVTVQMKHSVRDDLLRYLQSDIKTEGDKAV